MQAKHWWGNCTQTRQPLACRASGWWRTCARSSGSIHVSYNSIFLIEILLVHWGQEMWSEGLQRVWAGSSEAPFHESLQPAIIGLHIPPRIITHSLFVFIKKNIQTFALAPWITSRQVSKHTPFPHVLYFLSHTGCNKWNDNCFQLNVFFSMLHHCLSPQTLTTSLFLCSCFCIATSFINF